VYFLLSAGNPVSFALLSETLSPLVHCLRDHPEIVNRRRTVESADQSA
jgi:hypothetical protein